ncbi:MAG: hypothetical protein U9N34_00420, partial [Candidatus Cloacimonadota bacterium]|nr:hypothetical protein [Candidatus Cloacimonadota bacterium]
MKFRITVILLLLSVVIFAQVEWEEDLQIRQGVNIEWFRSATTLDDGVVYVWSDTQQGGRDLFAQKVDVDGNLLWNDGQPLTVDEKVDRQEDPVVIATTDNSVVVAWVDFTNDENYSDIYVQKISSSGELMWQEGGVPICLADNIQIGLNIIPNDIGGAIVIWQDFRNTGGDDIFGASIDENGNNVWDENGNPLAAENGSQTGHTFWEDGNGGAVMAYVDKPAGGNDKNIKAKGIAADGSISWTTMICDYDDEGTSIIQSRVKSAKDNEGGFIFVWQDKRNIHTDLYGQRINIDGEIQWAENGIRITEMEGNDVNPRLCTSTENGVFISWELGVATESDLYIT